MPRRRLALFGGTFDPPHVGHLVAASEVRHLGGFDELLLVVNHDPWQKSGDRAVTPAEIRLEMVRAAVEGHVGLTVSDIEVRRGGPTFTIDTVEAIREAEPDTDLGVVVGADAAARLDSWHRSDELRDLVEIVVVPRPGAAVGDAGAGWNCRWLEVPAIDVSSTEIRRRCADGRPIDYLVVDPVRSVIAQRGLYGVRR